MHAAHDLLCVVCRVNLQESKEIPGGTQMSEAVLMFLLIWKNCAVTVTERQSC